MFVENTVGNVHHYHGNIISRMANTIFIFFMLHGKKKSNEILLVKYKVKKNKEKSYLNKNLHITQYTSFKYNFRTVN